MRFSKDKYTALYVYYNYSLDSTSVKMSDDFKCAHVVEKLDCIADTIKLLETIYENVEKQDRD
jgi:hypothetical protein